MQNLSKASPHSKQLSQAFGMAFFSEQTGRVFLFGCLFIFLFCIFFLESLRVFCLDYSKSAPEAKYRKKKKKKDCDCTLKYFKHLSENK